MGSKKSVTTLVLNDALSYIAGKEVTTADKIITYDCKPILFNLLLSKNLEEKKQMKKQLFVLAAVIVAACVALAASETPTPTAAPVTQPPADTATQPPADTTTQPPADTTTSTPTGPVLIPWWKRIFKSTKK
jgi:hypothetical protein